MLRVSRDEAREKLQRQLDQGNNLADRNITSQVELDTAHADQNRWQRYTRQLLNNIFGKDAPAKEFAVACSAAPHIDSPRPDLARRFQQGMIEQVRQLESIVERLELWPEIRDGSTPPPIPIDSRKVFIVHGHDEAARETLCRFLEKLDLIPIVLHEQASQGRAIIEKIEAYADVAFAVVLMTADDVGASKSSATDLRPRARQNVILELGYFVGKIGRERVCALHRSEVEVPSDFAGVVYVSMAGAWQFQLAKEIRAAGIPINLNRLVEVGF